MNIPNDYCSRKQVYTSLELIGTYTCFDNYNVNTDMGASSGVQLVSLDPRLDLVVLTWRIQYLMRINLLLYYKKQSIKHKT